MNSFLTRFGALVSFVLCGFDRLRFRGESRRLNNARGVDSYLYQEKIRYVDFIEHCKSLSKSMREQSEQRALERGVPILHLNSPKTDKEAAARALAAAHPCTHPAGQIALLTSVESCSSYACRKNNDKGWIFPVKEPARCRHDYHYFQHPELGFCYVRVQTYFPFTVRVGLNGRQWLYQQLRNRQVKFQHQENLLTAVEDPSLAQELLKAQVDTDFVQLLDTLVESVQPLWPYLQEVHTPYYWTCEQSEWANDFLFQSPEVLAPCYTRWVRHGIQTLQCPDVLRFLGRARIPKSPEEVKIDLAPRVEGARIKFWVGPNSLKFYDKEGQALRVEHTINQPGKYKAFRRAENDADGKPSWRPLRKGVADMTWRAEIGQAVNNRLLESLTTVTAPQTLGELLKPLGQPVLHKNQRRVRALNPLTGQDGALLRLLAQGKFLAEGFRNADLREAWCGGATEVAERRRQSAKMTRLLVLLRAHGLITKMPKSHRYQLSPSGRRVATALQAAHDSAVDRLTEAA